VTINAYAIERDARARRIHCTNDALSGRYVNSEKHQCYTGMWQQQAHLAHFSSFLPKYHNVAVNIVFLLSVLMLV